MIQPSTSTRVLLTFGALLAAGDAHARPVAADRMPPYRGLAVDRIPAGKIQHVVFEVTTVTVKDGSAPPAEERALNLTQRYESFNARRGGGRLVVTLAEGRFVSDADRTEVPIGGTIDEYAVRKSTCRRWIPDRNLIIRWSCTGVNDRNTALLEHNETGLAHHYRHRRRSFYDIDDVRAAGRRMVRLRWHLSRPASSGEDIDRPDGAPRSAASETWRTARLIKPSLRLFSDRTRTRSEIDGHVYETASTLRVVARELLPDTAANRRLLRMDHPGAAVRRGRATHEKPQ